MDLSVEDLCGLLKRSRLVTSEHVHSIYDRWIVESAGNAKSTTHFTRWLVQQNVLTEYQASLLAKGMVDDFFLGEYKILERVGRGRMGGVYKAEHKDGRQVAIKVLPPSRTKIPALMARFQREAMLAQTFSHANVVRSVDVGETNGLHYFVMELLDGETVDDVLQRRKHLPPVEAAAIVHQTLLGLQHLHEHGVVHRDLKPSNLMLVPSRGPNDLDTTLGRTVKILDIGLARKILDEQSPAEKLDPTEVTQEGVLLGTPDYLSPEQARDPRAIDIRSDLYSVGCVLYHLLAGQTPFPDSNVLNLMIRHATEQPRPLRDFVPNMPDSLQEIVNLMTAKRPDYRYPTPAHAAAALQMFLAAEIPPRSADVTTIDAAPAPPKPERGQANRKPRRQTSPLPEGIELVPFGSSAPATDETERSPFAAEEHDEDIVFRRRPRPQKSSLPIVISACVVLAIGALVVILTALARR